MKFTEARIKGVYIVDIEMLEDERGFFAREWCQREFSNQGLNSNLAQSSISFNKKRGTLRGMHYQIPPYQEAKLVRCVKGSIYDVIIDLRPDSSTFGEHFAMELNSENYKMLYIPENFAHGFLTLSDNTEIDYKISQFYSPGSARGIRWNDPYFNISWPSEPSVISAKDSSYPDFIPEMAHKILS
ncbi:MAG: dTDP-4-dehydrorhamnose 3,5-epimerase [Bacillota bacterium]